MMFDWCCANKFESCLSKIIHSISTTFFFLFILLNFGYQGVQLVMEIFTPGNKINDFVMNMAWFASGLLPILIIIRFLRKRVELQSFFADWRRMENRVITELDTPCDVRKLKYFMVSLNYILYFSSFVCVGLLIYFKPEESYLLSYYKTIRDSIGIPLVIINHVMCILVIFVYNSLSDFVPGLIFYHASLVVQSIAMNIEQYFDQISQTYSKNTTISQGLSLFQIRMHKMYCHYEILSNLVKRANRLFGILMLVNHGANIFIICAMVYSMLYNFKSSGTDATIYFVVFLSFTYLLLVGYFLAAQLNSASFKLRFTLSSLMARHSVHLTEKDLRVASSFLAHLQEDHLAACPLNLYSVTSSNILTLVSLIISYVIVLLQS